MTSQFKVGDRVKVVRPCEWSAAKLHRGGVHVVEGFDADANGGPMVAIPAGRWYADRFELIEPDGPAEGDTVLATIKGKYKTDMLGRRYVFIDNGRRVGSIFTDACVDVTVIEKAKPPRPEWADRAGTVVRSLDSLSTWECFGDGRWRSARWPEDQPRTYEQLVRYTVDPDNLERAVERERFTVLYDPAQ